MPEDDYLEWYDKGPGSVSSNRKRAKEENEYKAALFSQRMEEARELKRLREENKLLKKEIEKLKESSL